MDVYLLTGLIASIGRGNDPAVLDEACQACASALLVDGVAMTLASATSLRTVIAASNADGRHLEHVQLTVGEGPCTDATGTNGRVSTADLRDPREVRWPALVRQLGSTPVRAVTALPLTVGRSTIGSLDVHSRTPGGLDHLDPIAVDLVAQTLTVTALAIRVSETEDLDAYLGGSAEIHQATGMVAGAVGVPVDEALELLRAHAFVHDLLLVDIARDIVAGRRHPDLAESPG